ncbi:MAG: hypothetical protein PWP52_342 [Bacteroidales bacterium]|nr:hypothetical protein [Bacteroidales bacterium]
MLNKDIKYKITDFIQNINRLFFKLFFLFLGNNTIFIILSFFVMGKIYIEHEFMKHPCTEVHKNGMNITWMFHKAN